MSEYQEFTGKSVEEALREARESFGVASLDDLDFEILTPGSRGVLGMGAEPARIIAAPRSALGGAAPRREAAASTPLPAPERPPRDEFRSRDRDRDRGGRGERDDRRRGGERDRRPDRGRGPDRRPAAESAPGTAGEGADTVTAERPAAPRFGRGERPERPERGPRRERDRGEGRDRGAAALSDTEQAEVRASRASLAVEREEIQAAEASPEALEAGRQILEELLGHMGLDARVTVHAGDTSKLDVTAEDHEKEALGALIGRKGERLSALQHLVNLMLSRRMGNWTRVLVDVEDYRGRRERQLREIALRAAEHVIQSGKMLQLEPMPALERRWVHLALRQHPDVATQSIGEEPQRRVVILRRQA
ncbi:MAG TPA: RNA-binding cell elongation regulator Jag/EloR [Candidatus Limnocylindria bacterium]|nr:RNA-binding cell elongation regulator Jag/EloR [Candidatus Limnocylindria bacterium]